VREKRLECASSVKRNREDSNWISEERRNVQRCTDSARGGKLRAGLTMGYKVQGISYCSCRGILLKAIEDNTPGSNRYNSNLTGFRRE
jgi:hypothetical protein